MRSWVIHELEKMLGEYLKPANYNALLLKLEQSDPAKLTSNQLIEFIDSLAKAAQSDVTTFQQEFGQRIFNHYIEYEVGTFLPATNCFDLLQQLQVLVDMEGLRLYQDAELPYFEYLHIEEQKMIMDYKSSHPFGYICYGFVKACIRYFDEPIEVNMQRVGGALNHVRFTLIRVPSMLEAH